MSDGKQQTGKRTLVEEGTAITGNMSSSCPIVVMGKIEGEISGPSMEITESGVVSGRIKVKSLRSRGELAGELEADTVELSGRVRDETIIRAQSLEVTATAGQPMAFGECELCIGEEPNKQRAIDDATGATLPAGDSSPERRKRRNSATVQISLDPADTGSMAH